METTTVLNLEQARKRSGVSLESIAESTKISSRFLRAIESEEFDKLPGGIFDTNYIQQYAAAIRFSASEILNLYATRQRVLEQQNEPAVQPVRSWGVRSWLSWLVNPAPARATDPTTR